MVCESLGIKPKPNNGTLHLPLKPVSFHSQEFMTNASHESTLSSETDTQSVSESPTSIKSPVTNTVQSLQVVASVGQEIHSSTNDQHAKVSITMLI